MGIIIYRIYNIIYNGYILQRNTSKQDIIYYLSIQAGMERLHIQQILNIQNVISTLPYMNEAMTTYHNN